MHFIKIYILNIILKMNVKSCVNDRNYKITLYKFNEALEKIMT